MQSTHSLEPFFFQLPSSSTEKALRVKLISAGRRKRMASLMRDRLVPGCTCHSSEVRIGSDSASSCCPGRTPSCNKVLGAWISCHANQPWSLCDTNARTCVNGNQSLPVVHVTNMDAALHSRAKCTHLLGLAANANGFNNNAQSVPHYHLREAQGPLCLLCTQRDPTTDARPLNPSSLNN